MTQEELNIILEEHKKWLNDKEGGELANLSNENLRNLNLSGANLYGANLRGDNLYEADLYGANLYGANLSGADLRGANLYGSNLYEADLSGANIYGADLRGANLRGANLYVADLSGADLREANLYGADLRGANLYGANLNEKIRLGLILDKPMNGWKKCVGGLIVELLIPKEAIVFSINNGKCRTNKAKVVSIDGDNKKGLKAVSDYDKNFIYEVGKTVEVKDFNLQYNFECGSGIHFFRTKKEAEEYNS